jgi:hypothetical protein
MIVYQNAVVRVPVFSSTSMLSALGLIVLLAYASAQSTFGIGTGIYGTHYDAIDFMIQ